MEIIPSVPAALYVDTLLDIDATSMVPTISDQHWCKQIILITTSFLQRNTVLSTYVAIGIQTISL